MVQRASFGRRGTPPGQAPSYRPAQAVPPSAAETSVSDWIATDPELEAWKQTRPRCLPWRQLSLMASLCFGVASFVLPASVNHWVDWLLYGLMTASFIAGLRGRRATSS